MHKTSSLKASFPYFFLFVLCEFHKKKNPLHETTIQLQNYREKIIEII